MRNEQRTQEWSSSTCVCISMLIDPSSCPPGWVGNDKAGVCYTGPRGWLTWEKARQTCQKSGGDLALPTSNEELQLLKDSAKR